MALTPEVIAKRKRNVDRALPFLSVIAIEEQIARMKSWIAAGDRVYGGDFGDDDLAYDKLRLEWYEAELVKRRETGSYFR